MRTLFDRYNRHAAAKPDRVVIFSDISSLYGGAEALALLHARLLGEAGVPVTFIAGDNAEHCPLDRSLIEVIPLGGAPLLDRRLLDRGLRGLYNAEAKRAVDHFVATRDTPGTIYHVHNWSQILSPSLFDALRPVSSRLFLSAHDFSLVCPNVSYTNFQDGGSACALTPLSAACLATHCDRRHYSHKLWRAARSFALRQTLALARSDVLIGIIHPSMADSYVRGGVRRECLRIVRNPVKPFCAERVPAERNSDLFFIGRIVHEKGVDLAAEAARLVGRRLRVIGDGDMREDLARRYPDVMFEGRKSHAEIGSLIRQARAVIVSSRVPEAFTLVAHESLRSGVPVVAFSDVDGQEAADIGAAIVVPPREASSLAAGLRQLDDDAVTERVSRTAFTEGWRFSNTDEAWRDAWMAHYGELLARAGTRFSIAIAEAPQSAKLSGVLEDTFPRAAGGGG